MHEAKASFAQLTVLPFDQVASASQLRTLLAQARFDVDPGAVGGSKDALLDTAADFLYARFSISALDAYCAWREKNGYVRIPLDELKTSMLAHYIYKDFAGKDLPADIDEKTAFQLTWDAVLGYRDGSQRPIGLVRDPAGLAGVCGTLDAGHIQRKVLSGELPETVWRGAANATYINWWRSPTPLRAGTKKWGKVGYCDLGIAVEFADGRRVPLVTTFIWNPETSRWYVEYLCAYNFSGNPPPVVY